MAERRNYYEIINKLSFDPVEIKEKNIIKAIDLWKMIEDLQGISQEEANGEQRQQELDMYEDIKKCLTDKNLRKIEADAMKQKQVKKLNDIISVFKESSEKSGLYVSSARIVSIAKSLRLDREKTVKTAFQNAGFEIIERKNINITKDILLSDTIFGSIKKNIVKLNGIKHKNYNWLDKIGNLYDLAAYFKNDVENISTYYLKSSEELRGIFETAAVGVAGKLDELSHCLSDLYQAGCTQVFKNEKNKIKYDNSLKAEKLKSLFSLLREMPEEMKKDSYIADICIKKIQSFFSDPDVALAIYNKESGNSSDPYEPDSGDVEFVCGSCKSLTKFKYGTEKGKCKCSACGSPIFIKCLNPKCSSLIPAIADVCPECGFNLIESKFFGKYMALAQSALDSMDLDEAKKQFALAKQARPEDSQLKRLEADIKKFDDILGTKIKEIKNSMNQKKYMEADNLLLRLCSEFPGIKVDDIRKSIREAIDEATTMFTQIDSHEDKCGVCFDILDKVKDYTKAIDYIKDKKPNPPKNTTISISSENVQANLQWNGTGEREVTYCVVRKENSKPISVNDGTILINQKLINQFSDNNIEAGKMYYYAVFSYRLGTYSQSVYFDPIIILKDLDSKKVIKDASNGKCVISWELPQNCKGIKISRAEAGVKHSSSDYKIISECSASGYEDKDVRNGIAYEYKLQCIYSSEKGFEYSKGILVTMTPDTEPKQIILLSTNVKKENAVQINWSADDYTENCLLEIYDINNGRDIPEGTKYSVQELSKIGNKLATISDISLKTYEVQISRKKAYKIVAFTVKGERAISSNSIVFSNFSKLVINKEKTKIIGGDLFIYLNEDFQQDLTNIRYAVTTKENDAEKAPWCTIDEATSMTKISLSAYLSDGIIKITKVPKSDLYLSIIGEYVVNGQSYFSESTKLRISNRPKAIIKYKIVWGNILNKRKGVKLIIECDRSQELPEMTLCCNKTIKVPTSISTPNNVVLCKIEEISDYKANTKIEVKIDNEIWNSTTKGNEIRLFIPKDSYSEFTMSPEIETLKVL